MPNGLTCTLLHGIILVCVLPPSRPTVLPAPLQMHMKEAQKSGRQNSFRRTLSMRCAQPRMTCLVPQLGWHGFIPKVLQRSYVFVIGMQADYVGNRTFTLGGFPSTVPRRLCMEGVWLVLVILCRLCMEGLWLTLAVVCKSSSSSSSCPEP